MANNMKKENNKRVALKKEIDANGLMPWPDLPLQVISVISRQCSTLMFDISNGGVIKSWKSAQTKKCNQQAALPSLELHHNNGDPKFKYKISFHEGEWTWRTWCRKLRPWQTLSKYYVGCSNGVLVSRGESPNIYYFHFVTVGKCYRQLPPWPDQRVPFQRAVISSSKRDPDCRNSVMIVLTGISHPTFLFYRKRARGGGYEWIKQLDGAIPDPCCYDKSGRNCFMRFTNAIGHKGKFYALSLEGTLAVIEDAKITALGPKRAAPTVHSRHFKECLLESEGEILLVFLISMKSVNIVDEVEVFRLDIGTLLWIKMERLGDRALFLGSNCCMSVSASKMACKSDCVYFRHHTTEEWWVYDFRKGISPCQAMQFSHKICRVNDFT